MRDYVDLTIVGMRSRPFIHPILLISAFAFATALAEQPALAYCRATACGENKELCPEGACGTESKTCTPEEETDCGTPVFWGRDCIGFSIQENYSVSLAPSVVEGVVNNAFGAWMGEFCDGKRPGIVAYNFGTVACDLVEYNDHDGNANIVVFRDDAWPHPANTIDNLALTTISYVPGTGEIYNADLEVNMADHAISTDPDADYNLGGILLHEAGHFFGLAHVDDVSAVMYPNYTGQPALSDDDKAGMCAIYPPKEISESCNPLPRHGFSPDCKASQTEGKCSFSPGAPRTWTSLAPLFAAFLFGILRTASKRKSAAHAADDS